MLARASLGIPARHNAFPHPLHPSQRRSALATASTVLYPKFSTSTCACTGSSSSLSFSTAALPCCCCCCCCRRLSTHCGRGPPPFSCCLGPEPRQTLSQDPKLVVELSQVWSAIPPKTSTTVHSLGGRQNFPFTSTFYLIYQLSFSTFIFLGPHLVAGSRLTLVAQLTAALFLANSLIIITRHAAISGISQHISKCLG